MRLYLIMAVRNLLQARRRSGMLFAALGLVAMLLVLLLTLSQGLSDTMIRSVTVLISGHINVAGYYKSGPGEAAPVITNVARVREVIGNSIPDLDYVIDRQRGWAKLISDRSNVRIGLTGVDIKQEPRLLSALTLAPERDYKVDGGDRVVGDVSKLDGPNGIVLFAWQAARLGVGVGDTITVSSQTINGTANTAEAHVIAVVKDLGYISRWVVFVPKILVQDLFQASHDTTGAMLVYLKDPSRSEAAMMKLRAGLLRAGLGVRDYQSQPAWYKTIAVADEDWRGEKLDLSTWGDEMGKMVWSLRAIHSISFFLVGLLLALIVVGLINGMWMAVRERTQEIGTLRAMGMARHRILIMFMTETAILGVAAATTGSLVAALMAGSVNAFNIPLNADALQAILMSDTLHLSVRASHILGAIGLLTVTTIAAALWPALRAARMQPVTAIAHIS